MNVQQKASILTALRTSTDNSRFSFRIITNVNEYSTSHQTYGFNVTALYNNDKSFYYVNVDQSPGLNTYTYMCVSQPNYNEVWFMDQASINSIDNYGTDYCRWQPYP